MTKTTVPRPSSRPSSSVEVGRGLSQRIRRCAELAGSGDALAQKAAIPRRTLETYLSGEAEPKASRLAAIADAAGVSLNWLVTGEGPEEPIEWLRWHSKQLAVELGGGTPHVGGRNVSKKWQPSGESEISSPALSAMEPKPGYVYLPLIDVSAAAGGGAIVGEGEHAVDALAFKADWIRRELHVAPEDLRLIYVEGNSMEPDLRAGDIILVDHTDTLARREGIYVIRMDGALLVKQLQRLPGGTVKVLSRNPAYEPFAVEVKKLEEPNGFAVLGRVVWACRRL